MSSPSGDIPVLSTSPTSIRGVSPVRHRENTSQSDVSRPRAPTVVRSYDPNDPEVRERQRTMDVDMAKQLSRARRESVSVAPGISPYETPPVHTQTEPQFTPLSLREQHDLDIARGERLHPADHDDIDVDVTNGRIQDFLDLAVKTRPVVMTGTIRMKMKLHVPYGKESVAKKMSVKADFGLQQIHMTNPQWQDKIDGLSLRAQGDPKAAKTGANDVESQMKGKFTMDGGKLTFSTLTYNLPGAEVRLMGDYSLDGAQFDFHGNLQTDAKLSQMVATGWKSFLLKAVDPFFTKDGKGAQVPVVIHGTKDAPKFGLDLKHMHGDEQDGSNGGSAPVAKPVPPAKPETH